MLPIIALIIAAAAATLAFLTRRWERQQNERWAHDFNARRSLLVFLIKLDVKVPMGVAIKFL